MRKSFQKTRCCNQLKKSTYAELVLLLNTLVVYLYVKSFSSFAITDTLSFYLKCTAAAIVLAILSIRFHRNLTSMISSVLFPIFLAEMYRMWVYEDQLKKIDVIGMGVILCVSVWLAFREKVPVKKKGTYLFENVIYRARKGWCLLLLVSVVITKKHINDEYSLWFDQIDYNISETKDEIYDYENSLDANIEEVSKLDPRRGWADLPLEEKAKVLETCVRVESRYYGLDQAPALDIAFLDDENVLGYYNWETNTVKLSYKYIVDTKDSGYSTLRVLCHEMAHAYQDSLVEFLNEIKTNKDTEKYANLMLFYDAGVYEDEMKHYISGSESYWDYSNQQLERTADIEADQSVNEYYQRIQEYLNSLN